MLGAILGCCSVACCCISDLILFYAQVVLVLVLIIEMNEAAAAALFLTAFRQHCRFELVTARGLVCCSLWHEVYLALMQCLLEHCVRARIG